MKNLVQLSLQGLRWILGDASSSASPSHPHYRLSPIDGSKIALPTPQQLAFQDKEIGVIIHFNIATFISSDGCNFQRHLLPDRDIFSPDQLSTDNWMEAITALGAKTATYVAKHNCGFTTWPTKISFPSTHGNGIVPYNYSIQHSPLAGQNIVAQFTESAKRYDVDPGFYYSLDYNNFLNVYNFDVNDTGLASGQVPITRETYDNIVMAQLEELWSSNGKLTEIWFDGGFVDSQIDRLRKLLAKYQPDAVCFNGCGADGSCVTPNPIRWVGTEEGHAPIDNWSTGVSNDGGDPESEFFAPAECDTATYANGRWFWGEGVAARSYAQMVQLYHETVGRNCFLELGVSPNRHGLIDPEHAEVYAQLGQFVRECYDHPVEYTRKIHKDGSIEFSFDEPTSIDRVVLMEDQTNGQVIRSYGVFAQIEGQGKSWQKLSGGKSVGHKKIDLFDETVKVTRVMVNSTFVDTPKWRDVSLHLCDRP
ncbi:alpha-L-fucosidase [Kockovaella imperatae]|uniref:alpha-L-fucosidase n=1 Tax=Kockovaella imperatae TaxID=4999 RepID=A0A1Y1UFE6_9TREE|nr:alpha-L-fucosidase [Kockovaella imperatae]ORX36781.1 alpha-L-fucosidase [Kockovaella imperatae]